MNEPTPTKSVIVSVLRDGFLDGISVYPEVAERLGLRHRQVVTEERALEIISANAAHGLRRIDAERRKN